MATGTGKDSAIAFDPEELIDSPHNLEWAASMGYVYNEKDRMYRDSNGRLVEHGTHERSLASFDTSTGQSTFW